jgi:hypothetical protein
LNVVAAKHSRAASEEPNFAFLNDAPPPLVAEPQKLGGLATDARKQALDGQQAAATVRQRVIALAAQRKALSKAAGDKLRELEKRTQAGEAASRKSYTAKANAKPSRAELLRVAHDEFTAASTLAAEVRSLRQKLADCEDVLVQALAEAQQSAADAKRSVQDFKRAVEGLSKAADTDAGDAAKLATAAQQEMTKALGAVGVAKGEQLAARREQAAKDDARDAADFEAAQRELAAVEARLARKDSK